MKSIVVGTAGHIDHGKTALVKALTGIDADRLAEEKRRGITIDLGFAHLELADAHGAPLRISFIDVPGHERFVRNMLAGVGGIDVVLLIVAADEGVKPQTREHFDICRLLNIGRGLTVITKSDLVDAETLDVVRAEVADFLRGSFLDPAGSNQAPIIAVSALKNEGLDELKRELAGIAADVPVRDAHAYFRLPIDRVFTMKGHGTVVTGTLISGSVSKEDEVELFPFGKKLRIRGVQVHDRTVERATAGQRTALNIAGVTKDELARGMMLAAPARFRASDRVDAEIILLPGAKPLKSRAKVHLHAGTAESIAEVTLAGSSEGGDKQIAPGANAFVQLRLAEPMLLLPGDRFILRQFSPVVTIGGGFVVDNAVLTATSLKREGKSSQRTHAEQKRAKLVGTDDAAQLRYRIQRRGPAGLALSDAIAETGWTESKISATTAPLDDVVSIGTRLFALREIPFASVALLSAIESFHKKQPLAAGMNRSELTRQVRLANELFEHVVEQHIREHKLEAAADLLRLPGRAAAMSDEEARSQQIIESAFGKAALAVPALTEVLAGLKLDKIRAQKLVTLMLRDGTLVKLGDELVFHRDALRALKDKVRAQKAKSNKIDVSVFKQLTGLSRKYAIPLLEWLDRERVTRRVGDAREIL